MSRFSDTVRDEVGRVIPGVLVYVYDWDVPSSSTGSLSSLTDDDGVTALPNPLTTDEFGQFYFNASNGVKLIEYHYGGKLFQRDQIILTPAGFYPGNDATIRADLAAIGGASLVNFVGSSGNHVDWSGPRGTLALRSDQNTAPPSGLGWANLKIGICDGTEDGWINNPGTGDNVCLWTLANSANGRAKIWGANFSAEVLAVNDASAWGLELDINNNGSVVTDPSAVLKKVGCDAVSAGPNNATAAYRASSANSNSTGLWHMGYYADRCAAYGFLAARVTGDTGVQFSVGAFVDKSDSAVSFAVTGGIHSYGLDLKAGTYSAAAMRLPNNAKVVARNAADSVDLEILRLDSGNKLLIGSDVTTYAVNLGALGNYANDAAAAAVGVAVGQLYRNGSVLMVRVA